MRNLLLVGAGGFLGSVARYLLGGAVTQATAASRVPFGTMAVNLLGCLSIGLLAGLAEQRHLFSASTRLFLLTGVLGGFTTYSAFAYETYFLGREQLFGAALWNVAIQVLAGVGAVWLGHLIAGRIAA
ncbi:MAG: fluoride efflux transporter CrcB [Gemmatimonadales bacterium]|nr:fluoride efflux transporter CrcB [Gemmatimonadales bacterium]